MAPLTLNGRVPVLSTTAGAAPPSVPVKVCTLELVVAVVAVVDAAADALGVAATTGEEVLGVAATAGEEALEADEAVEPDAETPSAALNASAAAWPVAAAKMYVSPPDAMLEVARG